jgi:hypothetical protein
MTAGDDTAMRLNAVELLLDIDTRIHRFCFRRPSPKREVTMAYVKSWRDVLLAEKVRQFELLQKGEGLSLPPLPMTWGPVTELDHMPCAVWIHLPKDGSAASG